MYLRVRILPVRYLVKSVNALTTDDECSRHNNENLSLPIQMQLSKKPNAFYSLFIAFLGSTLNFEHFEKNMNAHSLSNSEIIDSERRGYRNKFLTP